MASENLVIVESPRKARTIGKFLGREYEILASIGHIRDLPQHSFGVNIKENFTPAYVETNPKVLKQLRAAAKNAKHIYLAPDPDREGEAIAWHLEESLRKATKGDFHRVTFHEITRNAINRAFQDPSNINLNLVNAQQARRVLDRVVGYQVSPLLWSRIEKGISAGRVQTVALRLVCEREREIQNFEPKEYWNFLVDFAAESPDSGKIFSSKLFKINDEKFDIDNEEDASAALKAIKEAGKYAVSNIQVKPRKRYAPPPFITSTMQQAAGSLLRFSASRTMRLAQQLYEGVELGSGGPVGLITYMRTDSVNIANEAQESCRNYIASELGPEFVPPTPNRFKSKSSAQEAHEAVRPTDVTLTPDKMRNFLDSNQLRLYTLIWKRFVASQMAPAQQKQTTVDIDTYGSDSRKYQFRTVATVTVFPGFMKVYENSGQDSENEAPAILAELKPGMPCFLKDAKNEQKFTEPPPRYSEATLIRELEINGIGRPSTYAAIVNTIQRRNYVLREKGRLVPSELGFKVNDFLIHSLPELFQVGFTAEMENRLDKIEEGDIEWHQMLKEFYDDFGLWLDDAKKIGSPETAKAQGLLDQLGQIKEWAPKEKVGRRTYDDKKFFDSIKEKFDEENIVTVRQWEALLKLAVKYKNQLPGLAAIAAENGFAEELNATAVEVENRRRRQEATAADDSDKEKYARIFGFFDNVTWQDVIKKGNRTYDDKKFFNSLKNQAVNGKLLSSKQLYALKNIAIKYKEQIGNFDELGKLLEIDESQDENGGNSQAAANPEVEKLLDGLSKVETWNPPVKKGRRTFDDKSFYQSLSDQYKNGRTLSPRQIAALKKMSAKYFKAEDGDKPQS